MDLKKVLESTVSPDKNELEAALKYLEEAAQQNLPQFLVALSFVLRDVGNSAVARTQAGLQLKNTLYSKDPAIKLQYQQRWLQLDEDVKQVIKENVLGTLGTETSAHSSAAQCVAYIACAELPNGQWTDLIIMLTQMVTNQNSTESMKVATLESIGYICMDIDPDILQLQSNEILTAIVHGMQKDERSDLVKLAATNALLNSLEFTKANFDNESERNFIMTVICEVTQSTNTQVKVAGLQCLVKVMSLYYTYMEEYMGPALFAIAVDAMKSDVDEVTLQGIEFWSNVCDEEVDLSIEASEAEEQGRPPERTSRFYAKGALQFLVPILMQILTRQEEFDDDDDWNPCKAAGVCLMLMATCCENDVVPLVLPFVTENISNADWRFRDAAVMAFGSILEGPDQNNLNPIVKEAMPTLINLLKDPSVVVRDTAAWTLGRVCELLPDTAVNEAYLKPLLEGLVDGLGSEPRVAANVCWAFSSLAEAAYESVEEENAEPETYCLSYCFQDIVNKLLDTTNRADGNLHNLRSAAYEAVMELVKNSPKDCYAVVQNTTLVILQRLESIILMENQIQGNNDHRAQYNDIQSLLCATLQSVLRKVTPEDAPHISDHIMKALMQMFSCSSGGGVQEDALLAVSTLVEVLGENFMKYMEDFKPYLESALKNHQEYQVCLAAVGLTGDMCRALGNKVIPYCDLWMANLLGILANDSVNRSVKPQILSVFGDIALAIGPEFKKYLHVVLKTLQQASQAQVDKSDYDMIDYLNDLQEGCLEAYTGIIQGLKGDGKEPNPDVALVQADVPYIISFIEHVFQDEDHTDANIAVSCGLIGDLAHAYGKDILPLLDKESIVNLLTKGRRSKTAKTKTLAVWASKYIRQLKSCWITSLFQDDGGIRPWYDVEE